MAPLELRSGADVDRREFLRVSVAIAGSAAMSGTSRARAANRTFTVPIELQSRRLVVPCTIERQGPYLFAIDTGGIVSLIRDDLARQLKLPQVASSTLGIGGRLDRYPLFRADEVTYGNSFRQGQVVFAGVEHISFGDDVSGSFASGCLTTLDSEIDFRAKEWRIYPDGGPARDGWVRHDSAILRDGPAGGSSYLFGQAFLGSQPLRALLDTGAPSWIRLSGSVARKSGLYREGQNWSPYAKHGNDIVRLVRSSVPLNFGGLSIERPIIVLQSGGLTDRLSETLIGLPILQQVNLATDVSRKILWTRPNGLPRPIERYNMAGLWVDRRGSQIIAGAVGSGSPAEKAGIRPGDGIEGAEFETLIKRLTGNSGDEVALVVTRGGVRRDVRLVLADYL
jgi:hypothetical protein